MITDMADISQIIVADAASLDEYAFGITVIFERILERRIPMMDIRKWTYAAACDGNFRSTSGCILALLLSDRGYIPRVLNMNMGDSDSPEYSRESLSFQLCVQQYCQNNCDSYYDLLCELWSGTNKKINPEIFVKTFKTLKKQFDGYRQQDAQEFLSVLLEQLHEDLNRITEKPYIELLEKQSNENDLIASKRWWDLHKKREDSIIIDLFNGQFKSETICPKFIYILKYF